MCPFTFSPWDLLNEPIDYFQPVPRFRFCSTRYLKSDTDTLLYHLMRYQIHGIHQINEKGFYLVLLFPPHHPRVASYLVRLTDLTLQMFFCLVFFLGVGGIFQLRPEFFCGHPLEISGP